MQTKATLAARATPKGFVPTHAGSECGQSADVQPGRRPHCDSAAFVRKNLLPRDQHGNLGPTSLYTPLLRYTTLPDGKGAGLAARGSNGHCGRTRAFATPCPTYSPGQGHALYSAPGESRSNSDPVQPLAPPNAPPLPSLVRSSSEGPPTRP